MIRINLLPYRSARIKENIRKQISIFFLVIVLTLVVLYAMTSALNNKIVTLKEETNQVNQQIKKYKEKAHRVMKIKADLKALEEKLVIVKSLQSQRDKQLILFDKMTGFIVPGRMWLQSLSVDGNKVMLRGVAFDNPTIAQFMNNLEKSSLFGKVDLKSSKKQKIQDGVILKSFELLCYEAAAKKKEQNTAQNNNKGKGKK